MDDEYDNGGLGGFAWYKLGQWSAEAEHDTRNLVARLRGQQPIARAHYNHAVELNGELADENRSLVAQNQQLRAQIAALHQSVQGWEGEYEKLRAIANAHNDEYWVVVTERNNLKAWVANLQDELREIRGED